MAILSILFATSAVVAAASDPSPAALDSAGLEEALHTGDECAAGEEQCALNAVQLRVRKVAETRALAAETANESKQAWEWSDIASITGLPAKGPDWDQASSTIKGTIGDDNWDKVKEEFDQTEASYGYRCISFTKGTCLLGSCSYSRGLTECSKGMCFCQEGSCAARGKCWHDQKLPCEKLVEGATVRESAFRQLEDKCKCPDGQTIQGDDQVCQPYHNSRYFPLTLTAGACQCGGIGGSSQTGAVGGSSQTGAESDSTKDGDGDDGDGAASKPDWSIR